MNSKEKMTPDDYEDIGDALKEFETFASYFEKKYGAETAIATVTHAAILGLLVIGLDEEVLDLLEKDHELLTKAIVRIRRGLSAACVIEKQRFLSN